MYDYNLADLFTPPELKASVTCPLVYALEARLPLKD